MLAFIQTWEMDGLMYTYNAQVIKIVDGDTIDALIDIGFSV
tara:strand:- start:847 stop:969 length:123 start_codon:yes stop_codon:yes gene_type:complete